MFLNEEEKGILTLLGSDGTMPVPDEVVQSLQDTAEFADDSEMRETAAEILRKLSL